MIVVTIDGLNFKYAQELLSDVFPKQSMKRLFCDVRFFTSQGQANATPLGLTCMWSGERVKNLHPNFFINFGKDNFNQPFKWLKRNGDPLDMIWDHIKPSKLYEKVIGDSPYVGEQYWKLYHSLEEKGVTRVPCEELCIFSEAARKDYEIFWIHTAIVKSGFPMPGPYEMGRVPSLIPYDTIRKDKTLKREVYTLGVKRYKEIIRYLQELRPNDVFMICSDHGTWVDNEYTDDQIDYIPVIVNREIDLSDINGQWDIKKLVLRLKEMENDST